VGIAHDARGPNNTITLGDVSSLLALIEGVSYIRRDLADVVLVGGSGSRLSHTALPFRGAQDVTKWTGDPQQASRPFDKARDGIVQGEGAGVVVLETRAHAQARGAKPLARVAGCAHRFEPAWREEITGLSIHNALQAALQNADLTATSIGHVNANGNSTQHHDRIEAQVIHSLLPDVPVTAPKSNFGFLGAGTGMVELAASVGAIMTGQIPATLNYQTPDPECPIPVVHGAAQTSKLPTAVLLNHNSSGQAAAVILSAP
jgi:3-oxoacyl-[acyl-carrier-protein] synthase II